MFKYHYPLTLFNPANLYSVSKIALLLTDPQLLIYCFFHICFFLIWGPFYNFCLSTCPISSSLYKCGWSLQSLAFSEPSFSKPEGIPLSLLRILNSINTIAIAIYYFYVGLIFYHLIKSYLSKAFSFVLSQPTSYTIQYKVSVDLLIQPRRVQFNG